jgi:pimeloyl-ACP methyl ester carboxylesterase
LAAPVVFIHGLWLHASSWTPWVELFAEQGYAPVAPTWPGEAETVDATRENGAAMNNVGIDEVTDHYTALVAELPAPPILVGHSFGGLIAQRLLGRGLGRGCVALAPAPIKGVVGLTRSQVAAVAPVLSRPWLKSRTWTHTPQSFAKHFANGVPRAESDDIYAAYVIPAPCRPLFQAAVSNVVPHSPAAVDTTAARGPLLLLGGGADRTVPASSVRGAYKIQQRTVGVTEIEIMDGRGHSFPVDSGWRAAAEKTLEFLAEHGM